MLESAAGVRMELELVLELVLRPGSGLELRRPAERAFRDSTPPEGLPVPALVLFALAFAC